MSKDPPEKRRSRLFVALDLPAKSADEVAAWGRDALADPALRPQARSSLHLTLAFLGSRPVGDVETVAAIVAGLSTPPPELRLGDPVPRPLRGRPRLFALPVESEGVVALQEELVAGLVDAGVQAPEERSFWPHLTVARVRPEGRGSRRPRGVERPPGALPQALLQPIRAVRVSLYLSKLKPQGAEYTPLAHNDLR